MEIAPLYDNSEGFISAAHQYICMIVLLNTSHVERGRRLWCPNKYCIYFSKDHSFP